MKIIVFQVDLIFVLSHASLSPYNLGILMIFFKKNFTLCKGLSWTCIPSKSKTQKAKLCSSPMPKKGGIHVFSSNTLSPSMPAELLDAWDDDYNGIVIDSASLPSSANAFAAALRASLSNWKAKVLLET